MFNHMMDEGMNSWDGYSFFGLLFMFLFWALIILGIIVLILYLRSSIKTTREERTPLNILKERYAKGEIDKKEFKDKKKDII